MTGAFAALSAKHGFRAVQENNILDGERGLSLMLGMDQYDESKVTRDRAPRSTSTSSRRRHIPECVRRSPP